MEMGTQDSREKFLPYKIVYEAGEGEIVEKKSRFIASVSPTRWWWSRGILAEFSWERAVL